MSMYIRNPFDSGGGGGKFISGNNTYTGNFYAVQVIADAVLNVTDSTKYVGNLTGDSLTGVTFPAGTVLYGVFTTLTLVSGKVIAYQT